MIIQYLIRIAYAVGKWIFAYNHWYGQYKQAEIKHNNFRFYWFNWAGGTERPGLVYVPHKHIRNELQLPICKIFFQLFLAFTSRKHLKILLSLICICLWDFIPVHIAYVCIYLCIAMFVSHILMPNFFCFCQLDNHLKIHI